MPFHVLIKPRGAICNLDCRYCFYLSKESLYPRSDFRMSDEVLEAFTRQYLESHPGPEVNFAWQGGEPALMGLDFFRRAIALQEQYRRPGVTVHNAFQTNGTLLNDDWARFFKANNFLVGVSLDGPRELHDAYRVDKGGRPTFDRVMAGLYALQERAVEVNILACVSAANAGRPLEVYRFLRDRVGASFLQFIPIVEREPANTSHAPRVSGRSVGALRYGRFLAAIFDEWVRRDVGRTYVQIFDATLANWLGLPSGLCVFDETCGTALALEHNGDLYACDHFVEPSYMRGNLRDAPLAELAFLPDQVRFGLAKRDGLPHQCRTCEVRFACHGGCPKNRFLHTPEGEPGLNYLCDGYRYFFNHVREPMGLMAALVRQGRPAADVQRLLDPAGPEGEPAAPAKKTRRGRRRRHS